MNSSVVLNSTDHGWVKYAILTVFLTGLDKHCMIKGIPPHWVIIAAFAGSIVNEQKFSTYANPCIGISAQQHSYIYQMQTKNKL